METNSKSWLEQVVHNRLIALVLAMVAIVPLVAAPAEGSRHGLAALAFEGLAAVLLAALLWRVRWNVDKESVKTFFKTGANLPIVLFLGLAAVSCVFSSHLAYSAQELLRVGAGILLYFVVAYQFRRSEHLAKLVDTLLFVVIGAVLIGFAQYNATSNIQSSALFGDHQLLGSFLMLLLPVVAMVAITEKSANRQLVAQIATVFATTCLLLSQARSAWMGAGAGLVALCALAMYVGFRNKAKVAKHQFVLPLMLVVAAAFFLLVAPQSGSILGRMTSLQHYDTVSTWQSRQQSWQGAEKMIAEHPFTGVGLGLFPVLQRPYTHVGAPIDKIGGWASLGEQAHNAYLQTAAELGIPGLLLFVAVLVTFLVAGVRRAATMDAGLRRSLLMGSVGAVVAFSVDAIASPSWQFGQISMFLWLMMGLGVSCMRPQTRSHAEAQAPAVSQRITRPLGLAAALGMVAVIVPTWTLAAISLYICPVSAVLTPKNFKRIGGSSTTFTLRVTFNDGSTRDVSYIVGPGTAPGTEGTTFTKLAGAGFLRGENNRIYQSLPNENDTVEIKGTYTQTANPNIKGQCSGSVSDTAFESIANSNTRD